MSLGAYIDVCSISLLIGRQTLKKLSFSAIFLLSSLLLFLGPGIESTVVAQDEDEQTPPAFFVDVSESAGISGNRVGTEKSIGQAWADYDRDGWLDLYVTDSDGANTLYHNNQDGTFSISALADDVALAESHSSGASFADYDNDGWPDLYVLNWGENALFHNEGGRRFVNVTDTAGVGNVANGKTATWGDYDQDGYLDLYVTNWACYPKCGRPATGESDHLYHNNGDSTFVDVTRLLGVRIDGAGFVASFVDYDNDGDLDIYLVNDEFIHPIGNVLWRNDGPGCDGWCFTEVAEEVGANTQLMGMGLATGDYDNDGDLDFYFSNAGPMVLLQNQGDGSFIDMAQFAGVDTPMSIGWGSIFFDYDNDGWRDLYLAVAEASQGNSPANPLFRNNNDGTFTETGASGVDDQGATLGVAYGDYDNDGWVDLVIGNHDEGYKLFHNEGAARSQNNWLTMELIGDGEVNRDAIGSRVYVTTTDGMIQMQEVACGSSLGAGNALPLYFGLGENDTVDDLTIVWANGFNQSFKDISANQKYVLTYPVDTDAEQTQIDTLYRSQSPSAWIVLLAALLVLVSLVAAVIWLRKRTHAVDVA